MKKLLISMLFITMIFIQKIDGFAWGIGPYFGTSDGASANTYQAIGKGRKLTTDGYNPVRNLYAGIMIDSNVNKNDLAGYRVNLGVGMTSYENLKSWRKFDINNTLTFKLFQNEYFRLWMGPQLGLHLVLLTKRFSPIEDKIISTDSRGYNGIIDLGVAIGANIKMSEPVYFMIDGGIKYGANFNLSHVKYGVGMNSVQNKFLHGYETFLNMGFLYRVGEGGQEKQEKSDKPEKV